MSEIFFSRIGEMHLKVSFFTFKMYAMKSEDFPPIFPLEKLGNYLFMCKKNPYTIPYTVDIQYSLSKNVNFGNN